MGGFNIFPLPLEGGGRGGGDARICESWHQGHFQRTAERAPPGAWWRAPHPILTSAPPSTGRAAPVMKFASSEARKSAALATSQAVPMRPRKGTRALRAATTSARLLAHARAGVDRHGRVHQSRQDGVGANAVFGVLDGQLLGEGDHRRLGRLVGDEGVVLPGGDRGDVDDDAGALLAHDRQHVLARHHRAAQVDRVDAVEGLLGDGMGWGVAARDADADVVVEDVDAAPARVGGGDRGGKRSNSLVTSASQAAHSPPF